MGSNDKETDASAPDSSSGDYDSPPPPPPADSDSSSSSDTPPPPEESSSSSPPSSPPPSTPPPSPPKKSPPPPAPPSEDDKSPPPPPPPGDSESVSPPANKPSPVTPTTPALPDSNNKPTPSGSAPASGGGSSSTPLVSSPNGQSSSKSGWSNNAGAVAGVVVGVVLFVVIVGCCVAFFRRKKKKRTIENQNWDNAYKYPDKHHVVNIPPMQSSSASYQGGGWAPPSPGPTSGFNYSTSGGGGGGQQQVVHPGAASPPQMAGGGGPGQKGFSFEDLVAATNGFASSNMLGQGGFGFVHKGVLPATGKVVAVKSLKSGSGQGEREFQSEVEIISRVHHRHLVSLVGYCISAEKRLLVYEFVPNNNLEFHLYKSGNVLDFSTRLRIALGAAKGLAYLHEDCHPRIIHRDIKASNILLDYNFEAQVADFGLAKLTTDANQTHVSTRVMGTFGYLAPEYASSGKLTEKSDVFSFGVMLLELITGRRPVDPNDHNMMEDSLVDWARPLLSKALAEKNFDGLADPRMERNYNGQEMLSMVACAASSIRHSSKKRPRMSQIVRALEGQMSLDSLLDGGATKTSQSSEYDTAAYNADLSKFREIALGGSGNSSNATSTNPSSEFNINIHSSNDR